MQECRRSSRSGQVLDPHASSFLIGKHNRSMQSKGLACSLANRRIVSRPVGHGGIHSSKQRLRECGDPDSLSLVYCSLRSARSRLIVLNRIGQVAEFIQRRLDVLCEAPCPGTAASSEWQYDVWTGVTRPEVGLRATKAAARISRMSSNQYIAESERWRMSPTRIMLHWIACARDRSGGRRDRRSMGEHTARRGVLI